MRPQIVIRSPITAKEWDDYFSLRYEVLRRPLGLPEGSERRDDEHKAFHFAAFREEINEIIGVVRVSFMEEAENPNETMRLRMVAVKPYVQRNGVGRKLLQFVEQFAKDHGVTKMYVDSRDTAVTFYEANGYILLRKVYVLYGKLQYYAMEKLL